MKYTLDKEPNGRWLLRCRPDGVKGKRIARRFDTKAQAERFALLLKNKAAGIALAQPVPVVAKDARKLSTLVQLWYDCHGHTLTSGDERRNKLLHYARFVGDPPADQFDQAFYVAQRLRRIESGVSLTTTNHDLAYLKGMFNELIRAGKWDGPNPLAMMRKSKVDETEMAWLTPAQIVELLGQLEKLHRPDAFLISKLCLATGARWTEAETMTEARLRDGVARFVRTKGKKSRAVPIEPELVRELTEGRSRGFTPLFEPSMELFRTALSRVTFELPKGQATHVLRHTFAAHFVQNGGDILTLQKILGHTSVQTTMRYAHLAPKHLRAALVLNPFAIMRALKKEESS